MKRSFKNSLLLFIMITLALIVSAVGVTPVFADDETPPPPATEAPVVEEAALATETPVATDESTVTEANNVSPIADGGTEGTSAEPAAAEEPVAASEDEEPSVAEVLEQLPEDTALVVLDEAGDALPLATEEAAEVLAAPDPYFTVGGTLYQFTAADCNPGASGPQPCATPIQAAINYLSSNGWTPDNGLIYVEGNPETPTLYAEDVTLNGLALRSDGKTPWNPGSLQLVGAGSGSTTINGTLEVFNLTGSFTLQGFTFTNWVYLNPSGDVHVNDVVVRNTNYSLSIDAGGNVTVTDSAFDDSDVAGLKIYASNGSVTLDHVTAWENDLEGANISAIKGNVTVSNSIFGDNISTGLSIYSPAGSTTLNNVIATLNGENGARVTATGDVSATSSRFDDNKSDGLEVTASGSVTLNDVSAKRNGIFGASINANSLDAMDVVTITDSIFEKNGKTGLSIYSRKGAITLDTVTANQNGVAGVDVDASGNLSVICSEFKRNKTYGLDASEVGGSLTLAGVTFADNPNGGYAYDGKATLMDVVCNPVPPTDPAPPTNPVPPTNLAPPTSGTSDEGKDKDENAPLYTVIAQSQTQLPGALGAGNTFSSALKVILSDQGAQTENLLITLVFPILEGMEDDNLSVMFWDGAAWQAAPGGSVLNGFFVITVSRPGVYVLVSR